MGKHPNRPLDSFYENANKVLTDTLELIKKISGNIKVSVGRELSKMFEEIVTDNISNVLNHFKDGVKGEIVCMLYKHANTENADLIKKIKTLKNMGFKDKDIAVILSSLFDLNKNYVYKEVLKITV